MIADERVVLHNETDLNKMIYEIENIKRKKFIPIINSDKEILGIIKF
mgnify:CR=1 FL=1